MSNKATLEERDLTFLTEHISMIGFLEEGGREKYILESIAKCKTTAELTMYMNTLEDEDKSYYMTDLQLRSNQLFSSKKS